MDWSGKFGCRMGSSGKLSFDVGSGHGVLSCDTGMKIFEGGCLAGAPGQSNDAFIFCWGVTLKVVFILMEMKEGEGESKKHFCEEIGCIYKKFSCFLRLHAHPC